MTYKELLQYFSLLNGSTIGNVGMVPPEANNMRSVQNMEYIWIGRLEMARILTNKLVPDPEEHRSWDSPDPWSGWVI